MYHIRIMAYDGVLASSILGPIDVFTVANRVWSEQGGKKNDGPLFDWRIESLDGKPVKTASGQIVQVDGPINERTNADAVLVPGPFVQDINRFFEGTESLASLFSALRRLHQRGALIASHCTGSFVLAEAGLLNRRVATTHWAKAKLFERRYPQVNLRADRILTEQNRIICSAAVTTYLNLTLRLVHKLGGGELAATTAKFLLVDPNRISQASYVIGVSNQRDHADGLVIRAQDWMEDRLAKSFGLSELAHHLSVSERTLNRRFKAAIGQTPLHYLQTARIEVAKRLLETKRLTVDAVCERVGYLDMSTFRKLFKRETGLSPREYRRHFTRQHIPSPGGTENSAKLDRLRARPTGRAF